MVCQITFMRGLLAAGWLTPRLAAFTNTPARTLPSPGRPTHRLTEPSEKRVKTMPSTPSWPVAETYQNTDTAGHDALLTAKPGPPCLTLTQGYLCAKPAPLPLLFTQPLTSAGGRPGVSKGGFVAARLKQPCRTIRAASNATRVRIHSKFHSVVLCVGNARLSSSLVALVGREKKLANRIQIRKSPADRRRGRLFLGGRSLGR